MAEETNKTPGPTRFRNRAKVFVMVELVIGATLFIAGACTAYWYNTTLGVFIAIAAVWLQLSLMTWRAISYLVALLIEIAPAMAALIKLLKKGT